MAREPRVYLNRAAKRPAKAVETPPSHSLSLCVGRSMEIAGQSAEELIKRIRLERGVKEAAMIDLLIFSGCRVSEVCNIDPSLIMNDRQVYVYGLKGSNGRLCTLVVADGLSEYMGRPKECWSYLCDRFYIYRLCKEYGIYSYIVGSKRKAVTHAGRHYMVDRLVNMGIAPEDIKTTTGHKSVDSVLWYKNHKPDNFKNNKQ